MSGGGAGKKKGIGVSSISSSFAIVDKWNALCRVR